jgi:aminoglycoside/choline kinase family phosphotransferase
MMAPRTWTLRDYHSPNLLWCPDREGTDRIGLIDFQDAVMGHPAYDLVSLLQDARVDVAEAMELQLLGRYVALRRQTAADFDLGRFARDYAVMGAQRATKILGIFARLNQRDGKPHYLKHLPRIEAYTRRCLTHAALSELAAWYQKHVPGLFPEAAPAV